MWTPKPSAPVLGGAAQQVLWTRKGAAKARRHCSVYVAPAQHRPAMTKAGEPSVRGDAAITARLTPLGRERMVRAILRAGRRRRPPHVPQASARADGRPRRIGRPLVTPAAPATADEPGRRRSGDRAAPPAPLGPAHRQGRRGLAGHGQPHPQPRQATDCARRRMPHASLGHQRARTADGELNKPELMVSVGRIAGEPNGKRALTRLNDVTTFLIYGVSFVLMTSAAGQRGGAWSARWPGRSGAQAGVTAWPAVALDCVGKFVQPSLFFSRKPRWRHIQITREVYRHCPVKTPRVASIPPFSSSSASIRFNAW